MGDEEDDSSSSVFFLLPYLKEARGHGSAWHAIVGWHVAHHWTGGSGRTLGKKKTTQKNKVWHQKLHFTSATSSNRTISNKTEGYDRAQRASHSLNFCDSLMATQLFSHTDKSLVQSHKTFSLIFVTMRLFGEKH